MSALQTRNGLRNRRWVQRRVKVLSHASAVQGIIGGRKHDGRIG
jgi:hypothetical protein